MRPSQLLLVSTLVLLCSLLSTGEAGAESQLASPDPAATAQEGPPPIEPQPVRADFSIVYEGNTGGISGAGPNLWADPIVAKALTEIDPNWKRSSIGFGAFLHRSSWLLQPVGTTREFQDRTSGQLTVAKESAEVPVLLADDYAVFAWPPDSADTVLPQVAAALDKDPLRAPPRSEQRMATTSTTPGTTPAVLIQAKDTSIDSYQGLQTNDWEVRLRSVFTRTDRNGSPCYVYVVSRLPGEGARRAALVDNWRRGKSLYLSAGEAVEGRSYLSGLSVSMQRPITWDFWQQNGLNGLAPGSAELLIGVEALREEAEKSGIPLLSANLVDKTGEALFERWRVIEIEGRRVVLIGWSDPKLLSSLPPDLRSTIRVRDVSAVFDVLSELPATLAAPADLVVLFGVGARSLAGHLPGVDLVLGDFAADLHLPRWEEVGESALRARGREHRRARSPALVARLGSAFLGRIDISFDPDSGVLRRLGHLRAYLDEDLPTEPVWTRRVQDIRQGVYSKLEDILLPDLQKLPEAEELVSANPLGPREFAHLAANLMMERSGSDLAILRPLPPVPEVSGATQQLFVDAALSVSDQIVVLEVNGEQLAALARAIDLLPSEDPSSEVPARHSASWAWSAGLKVIGNKVTVQGRIIGKDERRRLVTTDFITDDAQVNAMLKKARSWRSFGAPAWRRQTVAPGKGAGWPLRSLVHGGLTRLRELDPTFGKRYVARISPLLRDQRGISPRFVLELDGIALQLTGSLPLGDRTGYESSRESRVQQQGALSAIMRGRIAGTWDDKRGSVTAFLMGAFGRSIVPDLEEPIELEDDLLLGAEGRLKVVTLPTKLSGIRLSGFAQTAFDSEFAPTLDDDGEALPRQRLWRTTAGASLGKHWWFKEFKAGFFVEYDFAAEVGPLSPGFSTSLRAEKRWGPVRWSAMGDLKGYLPTESDTAEDLLFTLQLRSDVSVIPLGKLIPGLSIGGFVDALLFRGKTEETSVPGMHLLVGAALSYDRDLRAPLPLR
jgi:hypothetical protein